MAYKFGQVTNVIDINIEDETFYLEINSKAQKTLENFVITAKKIKEEEIGDFDEISEVCLNFVEDMLGADSLDKILEMMPENAHNPFEYMNLATYIMEQITKQAKEIKDKRPTKGNQAPQAVRTRPRRVK